MARFHRFYWDFFSLPRFQALVSWKWTGDCVRCCKGTIKGVHTEFISLFFRFSFWKAKSSRSRTRNCLVLAKFLLNDRPSFLVLNTCEDPHPRPFYALISITRRCVAVQAWPMIWWNINPETEFIPKTFDFVDKIINIFPKSINLYSK